MKIVLQAGMGHKAEWVITAHDLESAGHLPAAAPTGSAQHPTGSAPMELPNRGDAPAASSFPGGPTAADIEMAIEQALDRKLQPVLEMLAESRQTGPGIRDILGGIGYIIGLVGLAAYLRYRRSKKIPDSSGVDSEPPTKDM